MASASPPMVYRSGTLSNRDVLQDEAEYNASTVENPLEHLSSQSISPSSQSIQTTLDLMIRQDPMAHLYRPNTHDQLPDEPPPPYEIENALGPVLTSTASIMAANAPEIAPVEYSCENSPQLVLNSSQDILPPPSNPARLSASLYCNSTSTTSPMMSPRSPRSLQTLPSPSYFPSPLIERSNSNSISQMAPQITVTTRSSKAQEAGFELQNPPSTPRSDSSSSLPSIAMLSSSEPLQHTRNAGALTAYLIPFPKPRLQGVNPASIPTRFLIYTPLPPPLSRPAEGEKESHWHKTQRRWQEDVRKATISNASAATWKGAKAKATRAIGRGVSMTKTTNLEFLDRVSEGALASTVAPASPPLSPPQTPTPQPAEFPSTSTPASLSAAATSFDINRSTPPTCTSTSTSTSAPTSPFCPSNLKPSFTPKPAKRLQNLTLIYPPSLALTPDQVREEFTASLLRSRSKSQRDALIAGSLLPFAAAVDVSLLLTFGGLTEVSAVWAHSSIRGAKTSKQVTKGLAAAQAAEGEGKAVVVGCTCGHHEEEFGPAVTVADPPSAPSGNNKGKGKPINLSLHSSPHLEPLAQYLSMHCLRRDFALFSHLNNMAYDVTEAAVLEAIGWCPQRREGRDLEVEDGKGKVEVLTAEEDEMWQVRETMKDLKRLVKKGAGEWVGWCRGFQKDPVGGLRK